MNVEQCWLHLCGTESSEAVTLYWELFVDFALIAAAGILPDVLKKEQRDGFVEFSVLYFSIINGWFLYAHHFASRFKEVSRFHCLLIWIFFSGMIFGILSYDDYQRFSFAMIVQRLAFFIMLARVACYVDRAAPLCAFLGFFVADSMLCYALAGVDSQVAVYLWGFAAMLELHIDLFLAIALNDSIQVPYRLDKTMDRFWAIVLAPVGAMMVALFTQSRNGNNILFLFSSITLMILFGLLYFGLKEAVCSNMTEQSSVHRALLLMLLKILGLALWAVGGCLLVLVDADADGDEVPYLMNILGWSLEWTLVLFLLLGCFSGRIREWYLLACWLTIIVLGLVPRKMSPMAFLSMYVLMVSILTLLESFNNMVETSPPQNTEEERRPLLAETTEDANAAEV
jgi:hypothetical protein